MTYDELGDLIQPSSAAARPELRKHRRAALIKNVGRARKLLLREGLSIAFLPTGGGKYCLHLVELPRHQCDEQTMAELTLGQDGWHRPLEERRLRDEAEEDARAAGRNW